MKFQKGHGHKGGKGGGHRMPKMAPPVASAPGVGLATPPGGGNENFGAPGGAPAPAGANDAMGPPVGGPPVMD